MSGVAVIRYVLANNAAVLAEVPAARIFAGPVPLKTTLPAIGVTHISGMPAVTMAAPASSRLNADRVQVMVHAGTYPAKASILALAVAACANRQGTINGVVLDSITLDLEGPDLDEPETNIYRRSRDFIVRWRPA